MKRVDNSVALDCHKLCNGTKTQTYYNTNSLLVKTPDGLEYGGVTTWQGLRYLGENTYLVTGTTGPNPIEGVGLIYTGTINCINGKTYYLNVPKSTSSSIYGPNYDPNTGVYSFVGAYINKNLSRYDKGFVYSGRLDEQSLKKPSNYSFPNVNKIYDTTILHSFSGDLFVGNSGDTNIVNAISFIYNRNNTNKYLTKVQVPGFKTTTTYGIWYNGKNSYTLVGGATKEAVPINKLYNSLLQPINISTGYIVDYNLDTNLFTNWKLIRFKNNITHVEGIYKNNDGSYSLSANVVSNNEKINEGYLLKVRRDKNDQFIFNNKDWTKLKYPEGEGYTSANSVANNSIVGTFTPSNGDSFFPYQVTIS
jgi:hypothetical protein